MDWVALHWKECLSLVLLATGVWWLMPRATQWPKAVGILLTLAGAGLLAWRMEDGTGPLVETLLFWLFAGITIVGAALMITNRNPVYSALWFAVVTLSVCGLFLLQFAPFLAAATVVVYAGAIVVTFVFVIMLAQQEGATVYDQRSRQPIVATFAAFVLLAMIVGTFPPAGETPDTDSSVAIKAESVAESSPAEFRMAPEPSSDGQVSANPLSQIAPGAPLGSMHALGRSLFGDYLFAVELAGTLLLVATIGAIAIAPRRRRGTL
jgi:NADH-quinone oxidoreductase subunit J